MKNIYTLSVLLFMGIAACSKSKLSDRDIQKQKDVSVAEAKKNDLSKVSGIYEGYLTGANEYRQFVRLSLEVKDVPVTREGSAEAVPTPKLFGSLRFVIGSEDANEFVDTAVKEADYYPQNEKLDVIVNHEQFGDLLLTMKRDDNSLTGSWRAPTVGAQGDVTLSKRKK